MRASVRALAAGDDGGDPVLAAVGDAARRHPVPLDAFEEIVDGAEMDVTGRRYGTFDELVGYCRCVAGSVGRLCLGVFGSRGRRSLCRGRSGRGAARVGSAGWPGPRPGAPRRTRGRSG